MRNVALDLGARKVVFVEVREGKVVQRQTAASVEALDELLGPDTPRSRIVIEACREAWHVHDLLVSWGHEVFLVDTTRVKQIGVGQHRRKTDRLDAEVLALALDGGRVPLAHVLSKPNQQLRNQLNIRRSLVEARAQMITTVRGIARAAGKKLPRCEAESFVERLRREALDAELLREIDPLLKVLDSFAGALAEAESKLEERCGADPVIVRLTSAPGVNLIVAAAFMSVIDDPGRFRNAHQVEAYLGLVPSEKSSGDRRRLGSITKQGNSYLRALLVQSAWSVLTKAHRSDPLRRWAEAVARRRGKRVAVVGLARRLAGVLWAMWRRGTVYDPEWLAHASAGGLHRQAQHTEALAAGLKRAATKATARKNHLARLKKLSIPAAAPQTATSR